MPSSLPPSSPPAPLTATTKPISSFLEGEWDRAMGRVPADKKGRLEAAATLTGVEASLGWRVAEGWDAQAWYGRTWQGQQDGGVRVRYTW